MLIVSNDTIIVFNNLNFNILDYCFFNELMIIKQLF